jgi:nickel-dependent lactate racemase
VDRYLTRVFAGDLSHAHQAGVEFVTTTAMVPVPREFDIVVSTAGGYPLGIVDIYQSWLSLRPAC